MTIFTASDQDFFLVGLTSPCDWVKPKQPSEVTHSLVSFWHLKPVFCTAKKLNANRHSSFRKIGEKGTCKFTVLRRIFHFLFNFCNVVAQAWMTKCFGLSHTWSVLLRRIDIPNKTAYQEAYSDAIGTQLRHQSFCTTVPNSQYARGGARRSYKTSIKN